MMKAFDIARKDLYHSARSAFFLVFGLGLPLLTALLFSFAFGGMGGDGGFDLPSQVPVRVVNLDEPGQAFGGVSAGEILVDFLQSEEQGELLAVTTAEDAAAARAAVDGQEAAVAVIIPEGFSAAAFGAQGEATIELYQDPALTFGPDIVKTVVEQLVDGMAGAQSAAGVATQQIADQGVVVSEAMEFNLQMAYARWAEDLGRAQEEGRNPLLAIRTPTGEEEPADMRTEILSTIMAGMMVFYVFFTGAISAETILAEDEAGTLSRLFTTPTPQSTILGGKFIASFVTLASQVTVLVISSSLIFGIDWGQPLPAVLAALGLVVLAVSFGLFITSFLQNTRQGGVVYGGVLTVTGMVGISSIFTIGTGANVSNTMQTISLLSPHGWALRAWRLAMDGGGVDVVIVPVVVTVALGVAFFVLGVLRFRNRFA